MLQSQEHSLLEPSLRYHVGKLIILFEKSLTLAMGQPSDKTQAQLALVLPLTHCVKEILTGLLQLNIIAPLAKIVS